MAPRGEETGKEGALDATLREFSGYCIRRAALRVLAVVDERLAPMGLRRTTFSALTIVVETPGLKQGHLADALAIERPNVVQIVDDLETAGLVRRTEVPGDRRARGLMPTEAGRALLSEAIEEIRRTEAALTEGLSPGEAEELRRRLETVEENARRLRSHG